MDPQHPEGTGKLASGAAACVEGLTRWHVPHKRLPIYRLWATNDFG